MTMELGRTAFEASWAGIEPRPLWETSPRAVQERWERIERAVRATTKQPHEHTDAAAVERWARVAYGVYWRTHFDCSAESDVDIDELWAMDQPHGNWQKIARAVAEASNADLRAEVERLQKFIRENWRAWVVLYSEAYGDMAAQDLVDEISHLLTARPAPGGAAAEEES